MKKITTFVLLALVSSLMLSGLTSSVQAQVDPSILLKIASKAQTQVENQLSKMDTISPEVNQLFLQGTAEVNSIEDSLNNDDMSSARLHFLTAMKTFKKITQIISLSDMSTERTQLTATSSIKTRPTNDLDRLEKYVDSLKNIASKHNTEIDFSEIDKLIEDSRTQIRAENFDGVYDTINKIKKLSDDIQQKLREEANKTTSKRSQNYIEKYLEIVDKLIEQANEQGSSEELIDKLTQAKENLSNATNKGQIIKEIRNIILLKHQLNQ